MPKVVESDNFRKIRSKLDNSILIQIEKLVRKIVNNPEVGKPMRNVRKGTREVYAGSFRLSYSFNKKEGIIYLLDFYHKDKQ